jgi:2-keto-4-pentenoate hydratase
MSDILRPKELIDLRRRSLRRTIAEPELPATTEVAYDFAAATVGLLNKPVAAWKLGATTAGTRRIFSTEEIYFGALLPEEVWISTLGERPPAPLLLRGEAEIAFRLALDIEAAESEALLANGGAKLFDCWAPAIEAPYSCVVNIPEAGLRALLMDRCSAGALYLGAPHLRLDDSEMMQRIEIVAGSNCLAQGAAGDALLMSPMEAARGFLAVAAKQGVNVHRGQWVSTGGITPCVPMPFGQPIRLLLGGEEVFELVVPEPVP